MSILYTIKQTNLKYKKAYVSHRDIGKIYDKKNKTHSSHMSSGFLESYKKFFSFLELKDKAKVLEIGCGNGALANIIPDRVNYMGIDISDKMISQAIKDNKKNRKNISFEKVDARDFLKFATPASYDLIILSFSRKYFNDEFKKKVFESLKSSGSLLMADDYAINYQGLFAEWEDFKKSHQKNLTKIYPYHDFLENSDQINTEFIRLGYKQTIIINFQEEVKDSCAYLENSAILDELSSEFSYAADHAKKEFLKNLKAGNFTLPAQNYYLALGKK